MENATSDEEAPLLSESSNRRKGTTTKPTPLPKQPITILLILNISETLTISSIHAYLPQLVSELDVTGGDKRKVGYYVGMTESIFYAVQSLTTLHWSRTSDTVGRKPILLLGLMANVLSMLLFGLSRTFWRLVFSRCISGLLDGNIGVLKSVMGDLTDPTNRAKGFALLPVVWSIGGTVGPILGGHLSRPHEHFPGTFSSKFWVENPYFLPCIAVAGIVLVVFFITVAFFKETAPGQSRRGGGCVNDSRIAVITSQPVPFRKILVYPVLISISNFAALSFFSMTLISLFPLFLAMPPSLGGMGASPAVIGHVLSSASALNSVFQALFFAPIVQRFGERRVFIIAMSMFPVIYMLFPLISIVLKNDGPPWLIWTLLFVLLLVKAIREIGFSCIFLYIIAAAPNKRSLGSTNGLAQTMASITRAIGPALSTSLFSWSLERDLLGGYAAYVMLFLCSCFALPLAARLPERPWEEND